jgi:chemotaxis signal transduction protein
MDIAKLRKKAKEKEAQEKPESVPEDIQALQESEPLETPQSGVDAQIENCNDESDEFWDEGEFQSENDTEDEIPLEKPSQSSGRGLMGAVLGVSLDDVDAGSDEDDEDEFEVEQDSDPDTEVFFDDEYFDDYLSEVEPSLAGQGGGLLSELNLTGESEEEYLCFLLSGEPYSLRISKIKEIMKPRELTFVPKSPPEMKGVLALRGEMIPVINLKRLLSFEQGTDSTPNDLLKPRIVVVFRGENKIGLYVDGIQGVIRLNEDEFRDPSSVQGHKDHKFVQALGKLDRAFVIVLDVDEIFDRGNESR